MSSLLKVSPQLASLASRTLNNVYLNTFVRSLATHWDPKFKKLRKQKFIKVKYPDFEKIRKNDMFNKTAEERRAEFIKEGIEPPISFEYKPINITTSSEIFDAYVPPEGDGKASLFSKEFASQALEQVAKSMSKKFKNSRMVKKYDESFDESSFGEYAQQIYIDAHTALMNRENEKMLEYVTEHAYGKMWLNMKFKTIRWKWVESLEPPEVKHIITREMLSKSNIYGQVTVRLHSKQILSVYDRFGRLAFGSDKLAKDVLEYVVFERHLSNPYGTWRMHDKIEPAWAPPKSPIIRSYIQPKLFKVDDSVADVDVSKFKKDDSHIKDEPAVLESQPSKPSLA